MEATPYVLRLWCFGREDTFAGDRGGRVTVAGAEEDRRPSGEFFDGCGNIGSFERRLTGRGSGIFRAMMFVKQARLLQGFGFGAGGAWCDTSRCLVGFGRSSSSEPYLYHKKATPTFP